MTGKAVKKWVEKAAKKRMEKAAKKRMEKAAKKNDSHLSILFSVEFVLSFFILVNTNSGFHGIFFELFRKVVSSHL